MTNDLAWFDGRDYALMVAIRADNGAVEIQHQAGSDEAADRQMARLAAEIIDQVGVDAVVAAGNHLHLLTAAADQITIRHPGRGQAVLACRCGAVIGDRTMHRPLRLRDAQVGENARIDPIVCPDCARNQP